jgi:transcriptional regulator with XRE-family HTH domain
MKTRHEILMEDPEYRRLYAIEGLVTDAAELVARLMEQQGVNKAELARRLGKSRAWATQLLNGKANMTMRTFAAVVHALGAEVKLSSQFQTTRDEQTSLPQRLAVAFTMPYSGASCGRPEGRFSFGDIAAPATAMQAQTGFTERTEYAA